MISPLARLRIALIADGDPADPALWSGTPSHMLAALAERCEVVLTARRPWAWWMRPFGRAIKALTFKHFEYRWSPWLARRGARRTILTVRAARPDVIVAIAVTDLAYVLPSEIPLAYVTDALIPDLVDYYDMFARLSPKAKRRAIVAERAALDRAVLVQVPSRWAASAAVEKQGVPTGRIAHIAWGANIPFAARAPRPLGHSLNLLFIGTDWVRKGGPLALEVTALLVARGFNCRIDIIGCTAKVLDRPAPSFATFHGFIDKSTAGGAAQFDRLIDNATLLLLPTLAEAYGIVFAEAAHHGLPVISHATGGVPSVVRDGETGILLPIGSSAADFAAEIADIAASPARYVAMSRAALYDARTRLNWLVWADQFEKALRAALDAAAAPRHRAPIESIKG